MSTCSRDIIPTPRQATQGFTQRMILNPSGSNASERNAMDYYSPTERGRQSHKNARIRRLQLQGIEAAAAEEETIEEEEEEEKEEEIQLRLEDRVNSSFHSAIETKSALSSSSASSHSFFSSFSSSASSSFLTKPPMRYSRQRRTIAGPRKVSKPDNNSLRVQKPVRSGTSSLSPAREPVAPSPSLSSSGSASHSLSSSPPSSPRHLPYTTTLPNANKTMLAVAGRGQHSPHSRGKGRYLATSTARPFRHSRDVAQQPTSQPIPWWGHWESVAVNLISVPLEANTFTIWQAFRKEGNVFSIDLFEDMHGNRAPKGKIRFKPAPHSDFWRTGFYDIILPDGKVANIVVKLDPKHQVCRIPSPVQPNISFPAEVKLPITSLDIGVLIEENTMLPMRTVGAGLGEQAFLVLDLKRRALFVHFQLAISNSKQKPASTTDLYQEYRLKIPFHQMTRIFQTRDSTSGCMSHSMFLESPPLYNRRIKNVPSTFIDDNTWRDSDTWFRQTHIVHNPQTQATLPVGLRKLNPIIDIGRWNAFKIAYPRTANETGKLSMVCDILKDYNVAFEETDRFVQSDTAKQRMPPVWKWIDLSEARSSQKTLSSLDDLIDETYINLPFSVRYQLEVCLSNGYLSEFTMPREFASKLFDLGEANARKLLEHVAMKKHVFYDPMKIFDLKFVKGVTNAKIPSYCCYMRSARVTPSTVYYSTPTVDISNRVIRYFIEYTDRFLRVRFTDEKLIGGINSTSDNTMDEVFTRIKRTLANGIIIGDRHYEFLAFGNSQFREHGAYFFAPLPGLTAANIRAWMGHFNDIKNVAKYAARLGQCFSTTRAVSGCPVQVCKIDDVIRNGYTFSDGVGRISKFLAQMATSELKIKTLTGDIPSAFQFRLGGSKGMLTVSSQAQRQEVHIRGSQDKFSAFHNGLEIIRWSQFSLATLNRQLILVLSTLGIPDEVFHDKLRIMLRNLDEAMTNDAQAIHLLKKYVDPNQMTLTVSQMVLDGFRESQEPFLASIMRLWRAWHLKYLKEKAKIVVDKGASLLGCMDETGTLKGYFKDAVPPEDASHEEKLAALPEIFLQVLRPDNGGKHEVIEGVCILARNPSLHPGDIRVVRAVNVPELNHLQDVVVLPQTGDRDISSMCSGGDLDGDDYLVIWDKDMIPKGWFRDPMDYATNKARDLDHDVTVDEITSFFVTYMKNDCLPRIAHAHLAWADRLEDGVNEEKCIQLAQLHSDAVDYNKTGNPAIMTRTLQPRQWPHFMEKRHKPMSQIYHSKKILGQLYDVVERVDFIPSLEMSFDKRILDCNLEVTEDLVKFSKDLKHEYDTAMRRIMAQHEIKTEFEVWSTFVLSHAKMSKDYKFHEELGAISVSLREGYRKQCYEKVGGRSFQLLAPLAVAMYRVTQEEMSAALKKHHEENSTDEKLFHRPAPNIDQLPLISFPWILSHILGKIALGHFEEPERSAVGVDESKNLQEEANPNPKNQPGAGSTSSNIVGSAANTPSKKATTPTTTENGQDDYFGLFVGDSRVSGPSLSSTKEYPMMDRNVDFLEQLVDFGFSKTSKSPQSGGFSLSPGHLNDDLNLLEFEDNRKPAFEPALAPSSLSSSSPSSSSPSPGTAIGTAAGTAGTAGTPASSSSFENLQKTDTTEDFRADCVEIVEEDVEPDAVDKLNELLGI